MRGKNLNCMCYEEGNKWWHDNDSLWLLVTGRRVERAPLTLATAALHP